MKKIKFYCVTNKEVNFITKENHYLSWVGKNESPQNYIRCDNQENIFFKENFYSELTFHYWYWKNLLPKESEDQWVGFCQKRRYWINNSNIDGISKDNINNYLFNEAPTDWLNYDVIVCKPLSVSGVKKMKLLKRGFKNIIKDPSILYNQNKQNLYLHFDMHHGYGNLKKAISELDDTNQKDFELFMQRNTFFNPHIMFISKPKIINKWFEELFPWLERCEKRFSFKSLRGYDTERLLAYLSERYLSYWFKKNYKCKEENWVQLNNF